MTAEQETLLQEPVFRYFHQLCQIPRPSLREGQISDYLLHWAQDNGLDVKQDAAKNIFIRKPASPGYEAAPCVMLQAHMDMVCEKAPHVEHDFDRDPIQWQIEGDRITTGGRTTLGADDGIGVAFAMAALTDPKLAHPQLEVLFTTAEEEDFSGSCGFDVSQVRASYLINLDHADEKQILCGSCGGQAVELTATAPAAPVPAGWTARTLTVSGLHGGHSGEDIHRGHGNATTLLMRTLLALEEQGIPFRLGPVAGGSFRLAIPRDAHAVVCFPADQEKAVEQAVQEQEAVMRREFPITGAQLRLTLAQAPAPGWCAEAGPVITAALLAPDGIYQMNEALLGLVDSSDNMGEFYLEEGQLRLVFEIRSAQASVGNYLYQRICRLAKVLGGQCVTDKAYPSWEFRAESSFRDIADQAYRELFGQEPEHLTVHAGLEVGFLTEGKPDIDAIAIGPNCWNFHSPSEMLQISSARKVYQLMCHILSAIH